MRSARTLCLLASVVAVGCYQRHAAGSAPAASTDAGDRDAGGLGGARDAGPPVRSDAGTDAEVPLSPVPVATVGPDGRPSDDPSAGGWGDPPDLGPGDPCCEPIGDPIDIPFSDAPWGIPAIEWNGDGWGVLYPREDAGFQELDRDGARIGPVRRLGRMAVTGEDLGFEWAGGRFFAVLPTEEPGVSMSGLIDRRGVRAAGWVDRGNVLSVAFVDHMRRWIAFRQERGPDGLGAAVVVELDDRLVEVNAETLVTGSGRYRARPGPIVGLKSRTVAFLAGPEDASGRPTLAMFVVGVPVRGSIRALEPIPLETSAGWARAARLRDRAFYVQGPDGDRRGGVVIVDPFAGTSELSHWPERVPAAWGSELIYGAVGVDGRDVVAACGIYSSTPDGPGHGALLRLFGADGAPLGAPVVVEEDVEACSLGSDGDRIFVAWPRPRSGAVRVQGYRLR